MKWYIFIIAVFITHGAPLTITDNYAITLKPHWDNLSRNTIKDKLFNNTLLLIGSITFTKKANNATNLTELHLQWQGDPIKHLTGSLYKKDPTKKFLPIESNLLCDGIWSIGKQTLMFNLKKKYNLGPRSIFYVVLTVPTHLEVTIKKGTFVLDTTHLPELFKPYALDHTLKIALN